MTRLTLAALATALLFLGGCSSSTGGPSLACDSAANAGPCTGTFTCGDPANGVTCDASSSACVIQDGTAGCLDISGASTTACPSAVEAVAVASCPTGETITCNGSSSLGITVSCN